MKNVGYLSIMLGLGLCMSACGSREDIDRADKKRAEVESENKVLVEDNQSYERMLKHAFETANSFWVVTGMFGTYENADSSCLKIGFTLPNATQFSEFKAEVYDVEASWQKVAIEKFYQKDVTPDSDTLRFALCRRDVNSGLVSE